VTGLGVQAASNRGAGQNDIMVPSGVKEEREKARVHGRF
jgi:hypothetical protein